MTLHPPSSWGAPLPTQLAPARGANDTLRRLSPTCMPHFLLTFGDASRPPLAAVIIEAPSMFEARMIAVVRRLAPGVPFGEVLKLNTEMMMAIPREDIGGLMPRAEAAALILRLVEGRTGTGSSSKNPKPARRSITDP
jgi:hypothetical protein